VIVTPELGQRWMSLVPLQPQGTRPPLFFIHGKGGEVHEFAALAEQLGPDQPVYGLRAAGLDDDGAKPASVEEMAALYVREIRALQPKGPYYLGGYSIGGMIAFETARQLIQVEQEVGLLALLDTWATNLPWRIFFRSKGTYLLRRLKYHTERIMTGKVSDPWNYARDRFDVLCGYFSSNRRYRLHTTIARRVAAAFARRAEGKDYYLTLAQYYRPLPLKVPVVLFMAEDQKNDAVAWRYLAPSHLEVQPVRGRHSTLLHRESAADLAAIFRWHLTAAQART
jgi:thioesterase domain-containing protein